MQIRKRKTVGAHVRSSKEKRGDKKLDVTVLMRRPELDTVTCKEDATRTERKNSQ